MRKMRIEMPVPDNMDDSDLLARMQELAVALAEEFQDEDSDDELDTTEIENEVSVQIVNDCADPNTANDEEAEFAAKGGYFS